MKAVRIRDARKTLIKMGAKPIRVEGSHERWEYKHLKFTICISRMSADLSRNVLGDIRTKFKAAGFPPPF